MNGIKENISKWLGRASFVRGRGLKRPIEFFMAIAGDFLFDKRYGVDTHSPRFLNTLKIESINKLLGVDYRPTRLRPFRKLMDTLIFPPDSAFVDFGCGKGKVLLMASAYNFKRITGVEFSGELCGIARENIKLFRGNKRTNNIEVVETDCVDYEVKEDDNIFFFFNPFEAAVMVKIINNIILSLAKKERKIWIIYNNPLYAEIIEAHRAIFCGIKEYAYGYSKFFVYASK